jgi:hypothetical protein
MNPVSVKTEIFYRTLYHFQYRNITLSREFRKHHTILRLVSVSREKFPLPEMLQAHNQAEKVFGRNEAEGEVFPY